MDKQQIYKEIIGDIIKKKFSLYGQALVAKISATGSVNLSPNGEVIAIQGDPKCALENVLNVFKEISGNVGVISAVTALKVFAMKYADVRPEVDEVISKFI